MNEKTSVLRAYKIPIKKGHRMFGYFDDLSFKTKNLYNAANFHVRQVLTAMKKAPEDWNPNEREAVEFINTWIPTLNEKRQARHRKISLKDPGAKAPKPITPLESSNPWLCYELLEGVLRLSEHPDYRALPAHTNQHTLKLLFRNWTGFYEAIKTYSRDKSGFTGRPRIPGYAPRNGRKEIYFTNQTCVIKDGKLLKFPMTKETLNIGKLGAVGRLKEVRVLPRQDHYIVEVVLEKETIQTPIMTDTPTHIGGIDLGLDNFAAIKTNSGLRPVLVKGNEIKAINQLYNKRRAKYQSLLKENQHDSRQLRAITRKRNDQVQDFLHKASRFVVTYALHHRIDTLVVGKNEAMKQGINIGRRNNQGFVQLPHARFIDLLRYKCAEAGIRLTVTEESYTSKASALDGDDLPVYSKTNEKPRFSGTRIHRGLYRSKDGTLVNADVNGAANIIRKVYPQALSAEGVAGLVTAPLVITRSILNGIPGLC